ncbi:MAG: MFS transporter, partial [Pseudomonadales bacterium]
MSSKMAFGIGQFAEGLKNTGFSLFILFYYNQVLGVSGTLAGAALFVALLFDAVTDPLAGSLSDNWKSKLGRRHPFMYVSAVPLAIAFVGLFSPPENLTEFQLFLWLTVFAILTRGAMTLYHVPHLALGAEMTENFQERTRIVAFRQFFGTFGGAAASIVGLGYFFADEHGGRLSVENYMPYALTLAILMVVTIWYSAWGTQK